MCFATTHLGSVDGDTAKHSSTFAKFGNFSETNLFHFFSHLFQRKIFMKAVSQTLKSLVSSRSLPT